MENLPIEIKKEGFFKKIFNFVKKIFIKEKEMPIIEQKNIVEQSNINSSKKVNNITELYKVSDVDEMTKEYKKQQDKKNTVLEIIKIIEKEPKSLKKLNIPQLEVIDNYYKEQIAECKAKIAKLS